MKNLIADIPLGPERNSFTGPGSGALSNANTPIQTFASIISTSIGVISIIAFIYFTFNLFIGALNITTAGSDKASVENARKKITNSLIGLVVTISAIFIIGLIGRILGLDFLNFANLITQITPN